MKKGWETIREALESPKKTNTLPGFFYKGGKKIRGDLNIAEGFNDFFANIGVKLDKLLPHGTKEYGDFLGIQPKCRFKFTKVSVRDVNY